MDAVDLAKKWVRPAMIPGLRALIRYPVHSHLRPLLWHRVAAPFFQFADYSYVARTRFGFAIAGNTRDHIQRYIYYFGVWEPHLTNFIQSRLTRGDVFLDVGANIGYFTLLAAGRVGPVGKVIAIEASPSIYDRLKANVLRNGVTNVETHNFAASDQEGWLQLYSGGLGNSGATTTVETEALAVECKVPARPLSAVLSAKDMQRTRVIKIDVEGAEWSVIAGMRTLFEHARDDLEIAIEITPDRLHSYGRTAEDVLNFFAEFGFAPYEMPNSYGPRYYLTNIDHDRPRRIREPICTQMDVIFSRQHSDYL
jgi:FkbM family methyltransferase